MASRLKRLTANDLGLADQVEVSVISASGRNDTNKTLLHHLTVHCLADYICKIQCTHKEPLELYNDSLTDDATYSTRKLTEVHHISQLRMVSKILTVEVAAEIDNQSRGFDPNNVQFSDLKPTYKSNAKLELETKDGKNIKEETPLNMVVTDEESGSVDDLPKERLYFKVQEDIQRASLSAWFGSDDGSSTTLRNIQTITSVIVADQ